MLVLDVALARRFRISLYVDFECVCRDNVSSRSVEWLGMDIDIFLEFASPPAAGRSVAEAYEDGLALARAADAAGFGAVWAAEHHFLGDYSNAAAPDMLLAAMARETRRIGLGFAVVPLTLHDPIRVAERLATLDILSAGRAMWGVGRGVTPVELTAFGVDPAESRAIFRRRFTEFRDVLSTGRVERAGRVLEVRPPPAPRLRDGWMAAVSPESFDLAAELGLDVMAGPFKPWPMIKVDLARHRRLRPEGRTSFTFACYCDEDHAAARRRAGPGIVWAFQNILDAARPFLTQRSEGYEHYRKLGIATALLEKTLTLTTLEFLGLAAVGSPEHVAERLAGIASSGVDRVSLAIGGGDLSSAETIRCVELLAEHVLPQLAAAAPTLTEVAPA
jgi:alkanesulfonate monooxygenase SsuD/methylene tetrahydromethanopterin reductase-like flavin-dependent oxidoreductase (luciferase family)